MLPLIPSADFSPSSLNSLSPSSPSSPRRPHFPLGRGGASGGALGLGLGLGGGGDSSGGGATHSLGLNSDLADVSSFVKGLKRRIGSEIGLLLAMEKEEDGEKAAAAQDGEEGSVAQRRREPGGGGGFGRVMGGIFNKGETERMRKFIPLPLMGVHRSRRAWERGI